MLPVAAAGARGSRAAPEALVINRYTVIGQPIAHSLSPPIHELFGELTQRRIRYTRTEATPETFVETVRAWQADGGRGCNVTTPFKALALEACDRSSRAAERAGSVNTIHMHRDGSRVGHTTDGVGLLVDLERNRRRPLAGRRVLLLGAGGAARAVVAPLLGACPALLHVANRTPERAAALADAFAPDGPVAGSGVERLAALAPFDIVVNATSASLAGDLPPLPDALFAPGALAYDMMYAPGDTVFMAWARGAGRGGLGRVRHARRAGGRRLRHLGGRAPEDPHGLASAPGAAPEPRSGEIIMTRLAFPSAPRRAVALGLVAVLATALVGVLVGAHRTTLAAAAQGMLPIVQLRIGGVPVDAEIASSGEQRYMGLSFRKALGENAGMLFVYPDERPLTFTMRNTLIPLSIAFISEALVIDEIVDMDVGPGQLFPSTRPARYALEVNQGWFERNGIEPGATITMP